MPKAQIRRARTSTKKTTSSLISSGGLSTPFVGSIRRLKLSHPLPACALDLFRCFHFRLLPARSSSPTTSARRRRRCSWRKTQCGLSARVVPAVNRDTSGKRTEVASVGTSHILAKRFHPATVTE
jgi:hypothetical protein